MEACCYKFTESCNYIHSLVAQKKKEDGIKMFHRWWSKPMSGGANLGSGSLDYNNIIATVMHAICGSVAIYLDPPKKWTPRTTFV